MADTASRHDSVPSDDQIEDFNIQPPPMVYHADGVYTKYSIPGMLVTCCGVICCMTWIGCIIFTFIHYGTHATYCIQNETPCNVYSDQDRPSCCNNNEPQCFDETLSDCQPQTDSIAPFILGITLITCNIYWIYLLIRILLKGMMVEHIPSTLFASNVALCMDSLKSKRINLHKFLYSDKITQHLTNIDFLLKSFTVLAVTRTIIDLPLCIINIISSESCVNTIGWLVLGFHLVDIIGAFWATFGCFCNCCRAQCCINEEYITFDEDCICILCKCAFHKYPRHHRNYAVTILNLISFSTLVKVMSGLCQIMVVHPPLSSCNGDRGTYFGWIVCANFLWGIYSILSACKVYWKCGYVFCFYWSRGGVHKLESDRMTDILSGILSGGCIFHVGIEGKRNDFVIVSDSIGVAPKVTHQMDVFTFCFFVSVCVGGMVLFALILQYTEAINQDYDVVGIDSVIPGLLHFN
eukprot:741729_1